MYNKCICIFNSQIGKLNDGLSKLEKIFTSVTIMTKLYWKEYQLIAQSDIPPQQFNNESLDISTTELDKIMQSEDNVIYENLVIRNK